MQDTAVQWSPDATLSYYVGSDEGTSYWLDPRCRPDEPVAIAATGQRVMWSPDGQTFLSGRAAGDHGELLATPIVDERPGDPVPIGRRYEASPGQTAWSFDNSMVLYLGVEEVGDRIRMRIATRDSEGWIDPVVVPSDQPAEDEVWYPSWSPDSASIVYEVVHWTTTGNVRSLELVDIAAPEVRHVLGVDPCDRGFPGKEQWAPDGSRLTYWVGDSNECRLYVARRTATGWTASRMRDGLRMNSDGRMVWAPDSRHLLRRSRDGCDLLWSDAGAPATDPVVVTASAPEGSRVLELKLSPDQSMLAFLRVDGDGPVGVGERRVLYLSDMSGGAPAEPVAITTVSLGEVGEQIAWAPDSSRLSVVGGENSAVVEIASGAIVPLGRRGTTGWSPDSQWIALYERLPGQKIEFTVRKVSSGGLEEPQVVEPAEMPDEGSTVGLRWAPRPY